MTKKELAREIAARRPAKFVEIPREKRVTRFTAHETTMAKIEARGSLKTTALLEEEQLRLIRTWGRE